MAERSKPVDWKRVARELFALAPKEAEIKASCNCNACKADRIYKKALARSRALGRTKKEKKS